MTIQAGEQKILAELLQLSITNYYLSLRNTNAYARKIGCSRDELNNVVETTGFKFWKSIMIYLSGEYVTESLVYSYSGGYKAVPWSEWEKAVLTVWSELFLSFPFDSGHVRLLWDKMGLTTEGRFNVYRQLVRLDFNGLDKRLENFITLKICNMLNRFAMHNSEIKKHEDIPRALILFCRFYNVPARINLLEIERTMKYEGQAINKCKSLFKRFFKDNPFIFREKLILMLEESGALGVLKGEGVDNSSSEDFWEWSEVKDTPELEPQSELFRSSIPDGEEFIENLSQVDNVEAPVKDKDISHDCTKAPSENAIQVSTISSQSDKMLDDPDNRAKQALERLEEICRSLFCRQEGCHLCRTAGEEMTLKEKYLNNEVLALQCQVDEMRRTTLEERDVGVRQLINQLVSDQSNYVLSKLYMRMNWNPDDHKALLGYTRNLFRVLEMLGLKPELTGRNLGEEFVIKRDEIGRGYMLEHPLGECKQFIKVRLVAPGWCWKEKMVVFPLVEPLDI